MGLFDKFLDRFNKAEFTIAPNKKLKSLSKDFKEAYDLSLVKFEDQKYVTSFYDKINSLSPHEKMVMKLMMEHMTTKEIAENMANSTRTVEVHRANVLKKMACISAAELAQKNERYLLLSDFRP